MKVAELIALLQQQPQDQDVVLNGYEGGYFDLNGIEPIALLISVNEEWYYGAHEEDEPFNREFHELAPDHPTKKAILIK